MRKMPESAQLDWRDSHIKCKDGCGMDVPEISPSYKKSQHTPTRLEMQALIRELAADINHDTITINKLRGHNRVLLEAVKIAAETMERLNRDFGMEVAAHARTAIPKGWDIFDFHKIIKQAEGK